MSWVHSHLELGAIRCHCRTELSSLPWTCPIARKMAIGKRKRVITSCIECYRRKQKCDRKLPCSICVSRDVSCSYGGELEQRPYKAATPPTSVDITPNAKRENEEQIIDQALKPDDLSGQTGYSTTSGTNSFMALEPTLNASSRRSYGLFQASRSMLVTHLKDRYQSLLNRLPTVAVISELTELYFREANAHVGVLEKYFFMKLQGPWQETLKARQKTVMLAGMSRESLYFPPLLFQMLAVATQYLTLDSPTLERLGMTTYKALDNLSYDYAQHGMDMMRLLGRHNPSVTSVRHDLMRAFWCKNCSRGTESWYILGDAIRQAQDMGLHLEANIEEGDAVEETLEKLWYDQMKKRLWVSLFNWDAHMCMVLGRPRSINSSDCTVKLPMDCTFPLSPPTTVPATTATGQTPSTYTRHLFNNFISRKVHESLSLGANRRYVNDYGIVKRLEDDVRKGLEDLPPVSRPNNTDYSWDAMYPYLPLQREHMLTFANSFLVALHRPHAPAHQESRDAAISAALTVLESQQRLLQGLSPVHYATFGVAFYTIDAGLYLSTAVLDTLPPDEQLCHRIVVALRRGIDRLHTIRARNAMAESGVKVLEKCYEKILVKRQQEGIVIDDIDASPHANGDAIKQSNGTSPELPDLSWSVESNGGDTADAFDAMGNFADFDAAFWTESMSSILNASSDEQTDDSSWSMFMT